MPVVFLCNNCRSRLKITRRKIGAQIECPRCQAELIVPTQEAAKASLAMADAEDRPPSDEAFPEFNVFDDPLPPGLGSEPPRAPAGPPPPPPPVPSRPPATGQTALRTKSAPPEGPAHQAAEKAREKRAARRESAEPDRPPPAPKARSNGSAPANSPPAVAPSTRATAGNQPATRGSPSRKSHGAKLLISRRMVYFQAFLIGLMALIGLAGGYLIGSAFGPEKKQTREKDPIFEIAGTIQFRNTRGELAPDFPAVAIALPVNKNAAIVVEGLRDARRDAAHQAEMAIAELGGAYSQTAGDGSFTLRLPKPGRYHLLLVASPKTTRNVDRKISDGDLKEIGRYLIAPEKLIGQSRYLWVQQEVRDARLVVFHVF